MNYLFLIKKDFIRDTQISSIGYNVEDLYANELKIKHKIERILIDEDDYEILDAEPFMEGEEYRDYNDSGLDFFGPVVLGVWQPTESESKEDLLKRIAKEYFIPLKYLIAVPIDSSFTDIESIFK